MAEPLRDLTLRLSLLDAGVVHALERANSQMDDLSRAVGAAQNELQALGQTGAAAGDQVAGGLKRADDSAGGFLETLREAQTVIGGMGAALSAFMAKSSQMATRAEFDAARLRAVIEHGYPEITRAIEAEVRRWEGAFTKGSLIRALIPVAGMIPEQADVIVGALGRVTEAVMMMGGGAEHLERTWGFIAQAIATGNAEMLMKASARGLPFAVIRGEEAKAIARTMSKDYDALKNAMILVNAITVSQQVEQKKLNEVMDTTQFQLMRLRNSWSELMEDMGKGQREATKGVAGWLATQLQRFREAGGAGPLGQVLSITAGILALLGGPTLIAKLLAVVGIGTGTAAGLLALLKLAAPIIGVAFAAGFAIQDVIQGLLGRESVIVKYVTMPIWRFFEQTLPTAVVGFFTRTLPDWFVGKLQEFYGIVDRYMIQPIKTAFGWLYEAVKSVAGKILGFFGITPPWEREEQEKAAQLEAERQLRAAEAVSAIPGPISLVVKRGGEIDWVATAQRHLGEDWESAVRPVAESTGEDWEAAIGSVTGTTVTIAPELRDRLEELAERTEATDRINEALRLSLSGLSLVGPSAAPTFTIDVSPGAVQVNVEGGLIGLSDEERERIISETLRAIEAQLRASLYEEPIPGVR